MSDKTETAILNPEFDGMMRSFFTASAVQALDKRIGEIMRENCGLGNEEDWTRVAEELRKLFAEAAPEVVGAYMTALREKIAAERAVRGDR